MVKTTTQLSIAVQLLIAIITTRGIIFNVGEKHKILTQILIIETVVQYIELGFYVYFLKKFDVSPLSNMARIRYYDWFFTTPTMLISTVLYFKYEEHIQNNSPGILDLFTVFKEEQSNIINIVVSNFFMLLFGYLGEKNKINKKIGIPLGFVFFANTFNVIYKNYAIKSTNGKKIFNIILPIWAMYGIGACLNDTYKNNIFNILDIFAKNFFSLFIYYKLQTISNSNQN
jgi:bacteriorhodopsin